MPLLFLVYINDIVDQMSYSEINLFTDDTCVYLSYDNRHEGITMINNDLENILLWSRKWLVDFNPSKTVYLFASNKRNRIAKPDVIMNNMVIQEVDNHKHLGMVFPTTSPGVLILIQFVSKQKKR